MVKFEGITGLDLETMLGQLQKERGYKTKKETRQQFVQACIRNVVYEEINHVLDILEGKTE